MSERNQAVAERDSLGGKPKVGIRDHAEDNDYFPVE